MRLRRVADLVGRALIAAGLLILLFVAYQLWGTGLREARSQRELRDDFEAALATTTTTTTVEAADPPRTTTTLPPPPPPVPGDPVGLIRIPKIGLDKALVEGVTVSDLRKGPGHYPTTPLPGQRGNAAIAGHRTTYGAPFGRLGELVAGDEVVVTTLQGEFRYLVDSSVVVSPGAVEVVAPTRESRLTLTTCNPRFSARERLVVSAVLQDEPAPTPPPRPRSRPDDSGPVLLEGDEAALSGDPSARLPAALWGSVAAAVAALSWAAGRRWRRLPAYLIGAVPFLVALFACYEQVARLLPANI